MMKTIAIFGIGRVGLPLALAFCEAGYKIIGMDINSEKNEEIRKGKMPFKEEGADELLKKHINKNLILTEDPIEAAQASILLLTLGTPLDSNWNPDLSQINKVISQLIQNLKKEQIIILRSTVAPGTTEYLKNFIEQKTDMKVGQDIYLAYCPERIVQGKSLLEISKLPQMIGADKTSADKAARVFKSVTYKIIKTDSRSAELAKIFCNMHRYINFGIANEFARIAEEQGCNIYEIIDLVNEEYPRGGLKMPGFTSGPCLYKDGFFLTYNEPGVGLIPIAWRINETFPNYLINRVKNIEPYLVKKKGVILGLSFKADIDDDRNSLSHKVKKLLRWEGMKVQLHDPFIAPGNLDEVITGARLIVIATNHSEYKKLTFEAIKDKSPNCIIVDPWNVLGQARKKGLVFKV